MKNPKIEKYILEFLISNKELVWLYGYWGEGKNQHHWNGINAEFYNNPLLLIKNDCEIKKLFFTDYFKE